MNLAIDTRTLGRLAAFIERFEDHDMHPSAVVLPPDDCPGVATFWGLPVVRGDRISLLFDVP